MSLNLRDGEREVARAHDTNGGGGSHCVEGEVIVSRVVPPRVAECEGPEGADGGGRGGAPRRHARGGDPVPQPNVLAQRVVN
eukprot:3844141-Pleurochrysis_carterae.AAC.2